MVYQLGYSNNAMEYFCHFYMIYSTRVGHHKGSLNHGKWKESYLMPFYKRKCDRSCPNTYRGLALGNVVYKIYTSILRKRLYNWANCKNLIPPNQCGFVPGKNTIQAANHLRREVKRIQESGRNPYLCFTDFTKALDTVNRRTLLEKLKTNGLSAKFAKILSDKLGKNYLRIIIGHSVSDKIDWNLLFGWNALQNLFQTRNLSLKV